MTTLRPTLHVVADVNQVVELGPAANARLLERPAVNGRVGSDLNVVLDDQRALLGKLGVLPARLIAYVAEAIGSQDRPRMDHHPIAQRGPGVDDHPGINAAIAANAHPRANRRSAADDRVGADAGSLVDDSVRANRDIARQSAPRTQALP